MPFNTSAVALAQTIPGWMSVAELQWLSDRASVSNNWLEIGTMLGRSWLCVAMSLPPKATIVAVDIGLGTYKHNADSWRAGHWVWEDRDYTFQQTQELMSRKDINLVNIKAESVAIANIFQDKLFDTVFIDACHTYEGTKNQINAYLPKLTTTLCGHDYLPDSWPGVVQAVDELLPQRTLVPRTSIWQVTYGPVENSKVCS